MDIEALRTMCVIKPGKDRLIIKIISEDKYWVKLSVQSGSSIRTVKLSRQEFLDFCESYVLQDMSRTLTGRIAKDFDKKHES